MDFQNLDQPTLTTLPPKNSLSVYILYFCYDVLSCTSLVIRTCSHYVSELGISVQWFPSWAGSKLDFVDHELWSWIICFSGTTSGGDICSISFSSSKCSRIIYFPVTCFQVASICPKTILPNLSKPKVLVKSTKTGSAEPQESTNQGQAHTGSQFCGSWDVLKISWWTSLSNLAKIGSIPVIYVHTSVKIWNSHEWKISQTNPSPW